ncbi:MAG: polyprenol monophosphomannose synthase, partial [Solirubrobacteraceae bacterium]
MGAEIWVVIPTYNEAENLDAIVAAAAAQLSTAAPDRHRILIVDDNSPDGTGRLADALAERHEWVEVLHRSGKGGLGQAYLAGFARALEDGAQFVVEMDADFSHDPRYLPQLLAAAQHADVALGSRYVDGGGVRDWGLARRLISRGGGLYARVILGVAVHDLTGGFKCIRREVLEAIDLPSVRATGYVFQIEVTYRAILAGFRVVEVPIVFADRTVGTSKMSG